jgi:hypothetical protein
MDDRALSAALLMTRAMTRAQNVDMETCRKYLVLSNCEKEEFVKTMTLPQLQLCISVLDEYDLCKSYLSFQD